MPRRNRQQQIQPGRQIANDLNDRPEQAIAPEPKLVAHSQGFIIDDRQPAGHRGDATDFPLRADPDHGQDGAPGRDQAWL
jgi:hypothetical protein